MLAPEESVQLGGPQNTDRLHDSLMCRSDGLFQCQPILAVDRGITGMLHGTLHRFSGGVSTMLVEDVVADITEVWAAQRRAPSGGEVGV